MSRRGISRPAIGVVGLGLLVLFAADPIHAESPTIDVLGIRLGMPLEEAMDKLKAVDPNMRVGKTEKRFTVAPSPTPYKVNGTLMAAARTGGRYARETIVLEAVPGPEPAVVTAIYRLTKYQEEPIALANTVAAINDKYGQPAFEVSLPTSGGYTWYYDASGASIKPPQRLSCFERSFQKIGDPVDLGRSIIDPTSAEQAGATCGAFMNINLVRDGDVVTAITTYAADERLRASRFRAMKALMAEAAAEANGQRAQDAASRGGPTL